MNKCCDHCLPCLKQERSLAYLSSDDCMVVYYCDGNLGVTFLSALRKINMQASKKRKDMLSKESYIFVS